MYKTLTHSLTTEPPLIAANKLEKVWPRVFVVEPDYSTATTIKTAIENEGSTWHQYDVMVTKGQIKTNEQLNRILRQIVLWQADVVIIEYLEARGDWLCEQIKKLPDPPIVILMCHLATKIDVQALRQSLQRQGADDFLAKPFNPCKIFDLVEKHWQPRTILA